MKIEDAMKKGKHNTAIYEDQEYEYVGFCEFGRTIVTRKNKKSGKVERLSRDRYTKLKNWRPSL